MEQGLPRSRQGLDVGKRESLMAQQIDPLPHQMIAKGVEAPFVGHLINKRQGADKHPCRLLKRIISTIKNRHADGQVILPARASEVSGQCHVKHGKGRDAVLHAK